jgi:protein-S-isoprenylcysteine O-methyltransferase Ste14
MVVLYIGLIGLIAFVVTVAVAGLWLNENPSKINAEKASRIVQFLFFVGLGIPFVVAFFSPGLKHLDELVGLNPLPFQTVFLVLGILLAIPGLYLMGASNISLRTVGSGANAFKLTQRIVEKNIYQFTRNPMSLGYYLIGLGIAFISGSTLLTLYVVFGIIPAHLLTIKFFEEMELELRFGEPYREYKQSVPFLFPKPPAHRMEND